MLQECNTNILGFILDRDGVINYKAEEISEGKYVLTPEQLKIYSDFFDFAEWAGELKIDIFVATNQQAVGLNLLTAHALDEIHQKIQESLLLKGIGTIKKFYVCSHLANTCDCRKPEPGLLIRILSDHTYAKANMIFVGDSLSDKYAADSIEMRFVQIRRNPSDKVFAEECVSNLRELIEVVS